MSGSAVVARDQRRDEDHHQQRRLGEESDHHLAPRAQRAEGGADVHRRERHEHPRAVASSPTSAIASAADVNGRRVPIEGMIAAAVTIAPNTT